MYNCGAEGEGSTSSSCRMRQDTADNMQWTLMTGEWRQVYSLTSGAVFANIPILVLVLTLEVYHFNHMPGFIFITVSTILALKSSCRINILVN